MSQLPGRSSILVVDDNPTNQALIRAVLEARDYLVTSAASAQDFVEAMGREHPDLILMDIQLPGTDGLELTRLIKADPMTAGVPVIALTAFAMPGDEARALAAGCNGYLSKPFRPHDLVATVQRALARTVPDDGGK